LSTTLERAGAACERMSFANYYRLTVGRVKPHVETLTGVMWDVPPYSSEIEKSFENDLELLSLGRFPSIEFYRHMVYLRQTQFFFLGDQLLRHQIFDVCQMTRPTFSAVFPRMADNCC
jgi:hypothetical protein